MTEQTRTLTEKIRRQEFLKELTALSRKYSLAIEGCGCCDSPYLRDFSTFNRENVEEMRYDVTQNGGFYNSGGELRLRTEEDIEDLEWWRKEDTEWQIEGVERSSE